MLVKRSSHRVGCSNAPRCVTYTRGHEDPAPCEDEGCGKHPREAPGARRAGRGRRSRRGTATSAASELRAPPGPRARGARRASSPAAPPPGHTGSSAVHHEPPGKGRPAAGTRTPSRRSRWCPGSSPGLGPSAWPQPDGRVPRTTHVVPRGGTSHGLS